MLKSGYTTGTCATAAAKAAVFLLFGNSQKSCEAVKVRLPVGIELQIPVEEVQVEQNFTIVLIRKYSGDDPDITDGMQIGVRAEFVREEDCPNRETVTDENVSDCSEVFKGVEICGGIGIGKITKPGLRLPVGEIAVNPTPRRMMVSEVAKLKEEYGIRSKIRLTIFAPEGEEIAKKTFNPKLGIEGGISILGTTGLVMPMSSKALIETIEVEMKFQKEKGDRIIAAPGAYGSRFLKTAFGIGKEDLVEFSNYPGEMLDFAVQLDVKELVICGHIGKMVKLAGGIMNTHSNEADARQELMAAHVLKAGKMELGNRKASKQVKADYFDIACRVLSCMTTAEAVEILKSARILEEVMNSLAHAMLQYVEQRVKKAMAFQKKSKMPEIEVMVYTLEEGLLARAGKKLLKAKRRHTEREE